MFPIRAKFGESESAGRAAVGLVRFAFVAEGVNAPVIDAESVLKTHHRAADVARNDTKCQIKATLLRNELVTGGVICRWKSIIREDVKFDKLK